MVQPASSASNPRKFLFARIGLSLLEHPKAHKCAKDGDVLKAAAVIGIYVESILYCRLHELDGEMPISAAEGILNGAGRQLMPLMEEIGWWTVEMRDGVRHSVRVFNYAEFNDTKATIDENRRKARERTAAWRKNRKAQKAGRGGDVLPLFPASASQGEPSEGAESRHLSQHTQRVPGASPPISISPSISLSDQDQGEERFQDRPSGTQVTEIPSVPTAPAAVEQASMPAAADPRTSRVTAHAPEAVHEPAEDADERPSGTFKRVPAGPSSTLAYALVEAFIQGTSNAAGRAIAPPHPLGGEYISLSRALHVATAVHETSAARVREAEKIGEAWSRHCNGAPRNGFAVKDWLNEGMPVLAKTLGKRPQDLTQPAAPERLWRTREEREAEEAERKRGLG